MNLIPRSVPATVSRGGGCYPLAIKGNPLPYMVWLSHSIYTQWRVMYFLFQIFKYAYVSFSRKFSLELISYSPKTMVLPRYSFTKRTLSTIHGLLYRLPLTIYGYPLHIRLPPYYIKLPLNRLPPHHIKLQAHRTLQPSASF